MQEQSKNLTPQEILGKKKHNKNSVGQVRQYPLHHTTVIYIPLR